MNGMITTTNNTSILKQFISDDFGIRGSGQWMRAIKHDSLVLDCESGVFFWNSKNIVGGPFEYLTKVRGISKESANQYLSRLGNFFDTTKPVYKPISEVVTYPKLVKALWHSGKNNREYWYKRLLTNETIDRFRLGYYDGWYTIPIFENGRLTQIQKRKDDPKMVFPWYNNVSPKIFNSDIMKFTDSIVFTEGIVDAILMNQLGVPTVSKTIGAVGWHVSWFSLFIKQKLIYLVYDNDVAGRQGARKMAEHLGVNRCKCFTFDGFAERYDVVDWFRDNNTLKDLMNKIRKESKYGFQIKKEFLNNRVETRPEIYGLDSNF